MACDLATIWGRVQAEGLTGLCDNEKLLQAAVALLCDINTAVGGGGGGTGAGAGLYYASAAQESGNSVVAAKVLKYIQALNTGTAQFLQVFDAVAVPGAGTVPKLVVPLPANYVGGISLGDGIKLTTALSFSNSTTAATLTAGAANCLFFAVYQ